MRLGGPVFVDGTDPKRWVQAVQAAGYRAAVCPVKNDASSDVVRSFREAAAKSDIVIAEVGAWSNPISPDDHVRKQAVEYCKKQLHLADEIGAVCCVNISGSRGEQWDGPHPDNLTNDTFALIVDTVRDIIDSVKPKETYYALESMPWAFPDSPDTYLDLIRAIDRERLAVHLDPVNLVNSPRKYYHSGQLIRECFEKLGPYLKSCHAKDISLKGSLTVHLEEVVPGEGGLDYRVFLSELNRLHKDTPILLEHLQTEAEYQRAAKHIRELGAQLDVVM